MEFVSVNVKEYVLKGIKAGIFKPFPAEKFSRIFARQGTIGEEVSTYSNGIIETTNVVTLDEKTNQAGWIATKTVNGEAVVDQFGHKNEWIIDDSTFKEKYELDPENPQMYKPTGGILMFVQIPHNIKFTAPWGEEMNILAGGYLNITNLDNIYGLQENDFTETYAIVDDTKKEKTP